MDTTQSPHPSLPARSLRRLALAAAWGVGLATLVGSVAVADDASARRRAPSSPTADASHEAPVALKHLRVVALDPGHGGHNHGCLGVDGTHEKVVTLQIAERVRRILLEETTATPLTTRRDDVFLGLRERTELANAWGADVFLSLHLNADIKTKAQGVEAWFLADDAATEEAEALVHQEEAAFGEAEDLHAWERQGVAAIVREARMRKAQADSERLAAAVAEGMESSTGARQRGVKQARFGVLKAAEMPAIVVEAGFLTHPKEGVTLLDEAYQEQVARGIVDGLVAFDRAIGGDRETAAR